MSVEVVCDSVPEADVHCRLIRNGKFVRSTAVKGYDQCLGEIEAGSRKRESQGRRGNVFANSFVGNLKFLPNSMQLGPEL